MNQYLVIHTRVPVFIYDKHVPEVCYIIYLLLLNATFTSILGIRFMAYFSKHFSFVGPHKDLSTLHI